MPRRRIRRRRRSGRRRGRRAGGSRMVMKLSRPTRRLAVMPHFYKRTCTIMAANVNTLVSAGAGSYINQASDSWVINSGTGVNVSYFSMAAAFTLDMLPDYTEFTTLYDQYKINRVKVKLTPYSTVAPLQQGSAASALTSNQSVGVLMHQYLDYDDGVAPVAGSAGINLAREYVTYRTRNLFNSTGKSITRYFKPRIASAVYGAGVFGSYANIGPKWIDSNSPSVQNYGWKAIWELFQPDGTYSVYVWFKLEATLYLECRQPR